MRALRIDRYSLVRVGVLLALCSLPAAAARGQDSGPFDLAFEQVSADVHLAYRPVPLRRYLVEGNVTIILNTDDVVVVDGSGSPTSARQVIAYIRSLTAKPVSVLVNTHGHGDHTVGNQEYVRAFPGVEIIARPEVRVYMTSQGRMPGGNIDYVRQIAESVASRQEAGRQEIAALEAQQAPDTLIAILRQYYEHDIYVRQQEYRTVEVTPPTMTFDRRLVLYRSPRRIEIRHLGAGDTPGDAIVYLPDDRMVITGDMVVHPIPYGFSHFPLEWAATLDTLATLDFDVLIPGHGAVQRDRVYLDQVRALLRDVRTQVQHGIAQGHDLETIRQTIDLRRQQHLFAGDDPVLLYFFENYFSNAHVGRTYRALTGHGTGR